MRQPRILIVDDNPDMLLALAPLLRANDYQVSEASTGEECLRRVREERPELILLDVLLPDISGLEVYRRIKADPESQNILVILISGKLTASGSRIAGLDVGADEYIARPIALPELLARLRSLQRLKEALDELRAADLRLRETNEAIERSVAQRTAQLEAANRNLCAEICEHVRAEQSLRESEKRYRTFLETAPDIIYNLSIEGTFTSLNPAFEKITGWSREQWLGQHYSAIVHPHDLPKVTDSFRRLVRGEDPRLLEIRFRSQRGEYLFGDIIGTAEIKDNQVVGLFGFGRDITKRKTGRTTIERRVCCHAHPRGGG
ncbi:MAG: PAS domain S-box protein [Verrucomicrobia bacterium]|nr:PAS domain S-box protein [Verrucomicrobiota bacterium]